MNSLVIDLTDPEMQKALANCEVGVPKTLTIEVTPKVHDDTIFVAQVNSVEYAAAEEAEMETEPEAPVAPAKKPYKPKAEPAMM